MPVEPLVEEDVDELLEEVELLLVEPEVVEPEVVVLHMVEQRSAF